MLASRCVSLPGQDVAEAITRSGFTIYDDPAFRPELVYDIAVLEARLSAGLRGLQWALPIRTRAKVAKAAVCALLGYPVPTSFRKTHPRFPSQNLDIFVQKSNNLQIWNEEVDPDRRYALIRLGSDDVVTSVRVLSGEAVALLDPTGTLTTKYQAARLQGRSGSALVSPHDTDNFQALLAPAFDLPATELRAISPTDRPAAARVLTIGGIYTRLLLLIGAVFADPGIVNERGRGVMLQRLVCRELGLGPYADAGQFPDILSQALEVKLQLSRTIDLGLVTPDSTHAAQDLGNGLRHCDTRYAVFYGRRVGSDAVRIDELVVTTGASFLSEFRRFEGRVTNAKLQIPLPADLFDTERCPD